MLEAIENKKRSIIKSAKRQVVANKNNKSGQLPDKMSNEMIKSAYLKQVNDMKAGMLLDSDVLAPKVKSKTKRTKDFLKINIKNLSKVWKINMRRFGQKEDEEYWIIEKTPQAKTEAKSRLVRPKSSYTGNRRNYCMLEVTSTDAHKDVNIKHHRPITAGNKRRYDAKILQKYQTASKDYITENKPRNIIEEYTTNTSQVSNKGIMSKWIPYLE